MRVLPNPVKEAANRRKHGYDFSRFGELLAGPSVAAPDDRPLGHEHEARMRVLGRLGGRVVMLAFEPVSSLDGMAARPISLRRAPRRERIDYEEAMTR